MNLIQEYIESLISSERLKDQIVFHTDLPGQGPVWADPARPLPDPIGNILAGVGMERLYRHQAEAIDLIRQDRHVTVSTATASGKTLIYTLPVLEKILENPDSRALYLFPLKALAQDQLRVFDRMASGFGPQPPRAAIYDGDTSAWFRKRIRQNPPAVILTNPEMLHLAFLPHHSKWSEFLKNLDTVVIDEIHTYRGILGSHMAQVLRRFNRILSAYGAHPTFVFCSATVSNPGELAGQLTGLNVETVDRSGAPRGRREMVFMEPTDGPARTAILLLKAALHRKLRTIVYCQSRKLAELIAIWSQERSGRFANRIAAYRAGFLPEERRDIESRLSSGDLLAVVSTSALELGIDIGDLDLCILVGYPGSVTATWQRGGRVGRNGQASAIVFIAGEDALDRYVMRHPEVILEKPPEAAVVNPFNPRILEKHLVCAAAELPIDVQDPPMTEPRIEAALGALEREGELLRSSNGRTLYSRTRSPHRRVDLRGTGSRYAIRAGKDGPVVGEIDGFRVYRETHPGAVYLHQGESYLVDALDEVTRTVTVSRKDVDYYTRVRAEKEIEILSTNETREIGTVPCSRGTIRVTDRVIGFETWRIRNRGRLGYRPLDLPPMVFETEALWFAVSKTIEQEVGHRGLDFMGGIHALEHAVIGIFPLLVLSDRNDLGGLATPFQPELDRPAVFIYDGIPGGAGLCHQAYAQAIDLLEHARKVIESCKCETGCPACVQSPKCGNGNRPIDKAAAAFILGRMVSGPSRIEDRIGGAGGDPAPVFDRHRSGGRGGDRQPTLTFDSRAPDRLPETGRENRSFGVFDIETQKSAREVGGWHRADLMRVSCAVLYDSEKDAYFEYLENGVEDLLAHLERLDLVIGFNLKRFDYRVLSGYTDFQFSRLPTLDLLEEIHRALGFRLSLDHLSRATLGTEKSADGLQALKWWKEGRLPEILAYCRKDVEITRALYTFGQENGFLLFESRAGETLRVPVDW